MLRLKYVSLFKVAIWASFVLLVLIVLYLSTGNFLTVSVLNSSADIETNMLVNENDAKAFDEYQEWLNQFEVNPEKLNQFVNDNAKENLNDGF